MHDNWIVLFDETTKIWWNKNNIKGHGSSLESRAD